MPTKKKQILSGRKRIAKFIVMLLVIMALVLLAGVQLIRISSLESSVRSLTEQNLLTMASNNQQQPIVDGPSKKAYIPEMNITLPYDINLTRQLIYASDQPDSSVVKGTIYFDDKFEVGKTEPAADGSFRMTGCSQATQLVIGDDNGVSGSELVSRHILKDGRHAAIYKSMDSKCQAFLNSADGGTLIDMLQRAESY
jgi:hypothetical protein